MTIDFTNMLNRKLAAVSLSADRQCITFVFEDGGTRSFGVEGDCCSSSWIEHLEIPENVAGAKLLSVEDSAPLTQDHDDHDDDGEISVYNTAFRTDRGEVVLEYRNSSNGYYGGYLVDVLS
jgi:hypothetical protein